jgi:hypothetical protein
LGELVKKPITGNATKCDYFSIGEFSDSPAPPSHWIVMTRDVIEGSRNQCYQDQQTLLIRNGRSAYEVPTLLDATVCIFIEYIRTATRLYSNSPYTYTSCQEKHDGCWQLAVGGFGPDGLSVDYVGLNEDGVGGIRKL